MNNNATDEDIVNAAITIPGIVNYGTYDRLILDQTFMVDIKDVRPMDAYALSRLGFVDVQYVSLPINNRDVTKELFTFNHRWRNLRQFSNYADFIKWETDELDADKEKVQIEREFIKKQNEFQSTNITYIEKQEGLIDSQKKTNTDIQETNRNTRETNFTIKAILIVTAAIYLGQLFVSIYGIASNKNETPTQLQLAQQDSLIKIMEIRLYQKENQEYHYLSERDSLRRVLDSVLHAP